MQKWKKFLFWGLLVIMSTKFFLFDETQHVLDMSSRQIEEALNHASHETDDYLDNVIFRGQIMASLLSQSMEHTGIQQFVLEEQAGSPIVWFVLPMNDESAKPPLITKIPASGPAIEMMLDQRQTLLIKRFPIVQEYQQTAALIAIIPLEELIRYLAHDVPHREHALALYDNNGLPIGYLNMGKDGVRYPLQSIPLAGPSMRAYAKTTYFSEDGQPITYHARGIAEGLNVVLISREPSLVTVGLTILLKYSFIFCALFAALRYIQRIQQLEREIQTAHDLAKYERLSALGQLATGIAHEIKNPLTAIKGFLQLVEQRLPRPPSEETLGILMVEIERIEKVIGTFSHLARPATSKREFCDPGKLIQDVHGLLYSQAILKNIHFELRLDPRAKEIYVDGDQIKQVLINLAKNAIEAVDKGGWVRIEVQHEISNEGVRILVLDNGSGISEGLVQRLGTPFLTTKAEGTGIGLTVSFDIIKQHGGHIAIKSELGKGSTFVVWLPYQGHMGTQHG